MGEKKYSVEFFLFCSGRRIKAAFGLFVLVLFVISGSTHGSAYFYQGLQYGSEACYTAPRVIINGGYDIFQARQENDPFAVDYITALKNISYQLIHPVRQIRAYGWKDYIGNEIIPLSLNNENAQYLPNYQLHLIGGGITYRSLYEKYHYRNFNYPKLRAVTVCFSYHMLNEVVENDFYDGVNVDPITDLYIFDPLGILLFSHDGVARFFGKTLHARDWSSLPFINLLNGHLEDPSQNYAFKWNLPYLRKWSLFYYIGMSGITGLSYKTERGYSFSGGLGLAVSELFNVGSEEIRKLSVRLKWHGGFFIDRNHSLLFSAFISGQRLYRFKSTLYPCENISIKGFRPGLFFAIGSGSSVLFGISAVKVFPLGIAI